MPNVLHHTGSSGWVLALAYLTSLVGCYVGVLCTVRTARPSGSIPRWAWRVMAAAAVGGVGIWLTHFIAMLGFTVPGTLIRYRPAPVLLSAVIAVTAAGAGLWLATTRPTEHRRGPLLARSVSGGLVLGGAVGAMHYIGMAAVDVQGALTHTPAVVTASLLACIVAATVALWLIRISPHRRPFGPAMILGAAVATVHLIGMAGASVTLDPDAPIPHGWTVISMLLPAFVFGAIALAVPLVALVSAPSAPDRPQAPVAETITFSEPENNFDADAPHPSSRVPPPIYEAGRFLDARRYVPRPRPHPPTDKP
ncbi:hypothetical protein IM25_23595 (plasmid) [Rhodococcus sp. p52]|uniref:MHYT domain-containing protein n=1 Tax=Rhodococcus sp. p52 TaxID=935199 RepID=UPI00068C16A9|nr:MHYT domain-containing protein [Rhodococcus sp. p52]AOD24732.1 hypothetical protein IM25_23595 [Rhodococcus sp. p52]